RWLLAPRTCLSLSLRACLSVSFVFELPELLAHRDKGGGLVWLNMVCRFQACLADLASTLGGGRGRAVCVRPEKNDFEHPDQRQRDAKPKEYMFGRGPHNQGVCTDGKERTDVSTAKFIDASKVRNVARYDSTANSCKHEAH